ncbi:5'-3' exonuclease [Lentibacillus cibarius]|uniref:5'-3' exonuclease n=1 Tax=Lentibacillus cibarius TaxID=2583219 RepID=A0A549YKU1_9BACI|nr:5'-3' exonuclease H3TH domain-containing protein [Lentibacillus cibarius]TMN23677.1 5'-3' exonuclease [Lentibacillus cibarius]TRM12506.1 5'-3' exonuclease [Lentibacillus cibarius]
MAKNKKVLLVDGMALLFRGFYATAFSGNFMYTKDGIPTNGVYQFLQYFFNAVHRFEPTHVICCWDMGSKTFRTALYPDYKGNRPKPPEALVPQFDLIKEVTQAFNIPNVGRENFEADDCIGSLARQFSSDHEVLILTGDQDMLQLVDAGISVAIMKKGIGNYELFDCDTFYDKKGIHPQQIIDLKGLMGDSSDNYPGVKGIGEKTALKLLREYGTIDNLLANLECLPNGTERKIRENIDMLQLSKKLAAIRCDVTVSCTPDEALWHYEPLLVEEAFAELAFPNLMELVT